MREKLPRALAFAVSVLTAASSVRAERAPGAAEFPTEIDAIVELGGLAPLYHDIQFGREGTEFDYIEDGGHDVLFPFGRVSMEVGARRHRVVFLYQPLELDSKVTLREPLTVDGLTFEPETPLDLEYGFPFYRVSYLYELTNRRSFDVSLGASLQIRNATITFTAADGSGRRDYRSLGPVPALKARVRYVAQSGWFLGAEVDGFYAPVKYLNGGDSDVEGAIVDASLRAGYELPGGPAAFLNLRWLGGGAEGTSEPEDFGDGYSENWLHFVIVSLGVQVPLI